MDKPNKKFAPSNILTPGSETRQTLPQINSSPQSTLQKLFPSSPTEQVQSTEIQLATNKTEENKSPSAILEDGKQEDKEEEEEEEEGEEEGFVKGTTAANLEFY